MRAIVVAALLLPLVACDSAQLEPFLPMKSQRFDMQDTVSGHLTHFSLAPINSAGCLSGPMMVWSVRKDHIEDYWNPGDDAWGDALIQQSSDGAWQARIDAAHDVGTKAYPQWPDFTQWMSTAAGEYPYLMVPSNAMAAQARNGEVVLTGMTRYKVWGNIRTFACLTQPPNLNFTMRWTSKIRWERTDTPVYQGEALVLEQFEGCTPEEETPDSVACAHEVDYFARGLGYIEINSIWENRDIKRIN